uniref:RNA polymerase sigma factor region1.1 domain-containing protein n=1 Tax=Chloroflexus sp. TaxID=1904827 RepID=UPI002ACEBBBD
LEELGLPADEKAQFQGQGTTGSASDAFSELSGLQPFSLDDLDLGTSTSASELPPSLQPFSLDDLALDEPAPAAHTETVEPGIYSWQEPSARGGGIQLPQEPEPSGPSIFSKLVERAAALPPIEEPPLPAVELTEADVAAYFSNDDVSLREDDGSPERLTGTFRLPKPSLDESLAPSGAVSAVSGKGEAPLKPEAAEPELTPFSLEELGLSPEEIAQLEGQAAPPAAQAEPELTPFSLEELGLSPEEIAQLEAMQQGEQQPAAQAEPELTPFSLEELGLSPEEIAQLEALQQGEQQPAAQAEPELTPFSLEELGLSPEEIAQLEALQQGEQQPAAQAEPELTPFSLEELGLSPEEIAQLEAMQQGEQQPAAQAEPELTPFSLADLGLSPEEIAQLEALQQGEQQPAAKGQVSSGVDESIESLLAPAETTDSNILADLGISPATPETSFELPGVEPFSLDEFGDLEPFSFDDLESGAAASGGELAIPPEEIDNLNLGGFETVVFSDDQEPMIDTGDPVLNRLIQLGHRQGYVDLTDIIAVVQDPEREADRIEQLGWSLHRAGIQIRDGDEIIDMEAELGEEEAMLEAPVAEADLTPFAEEMPPAAQAEPELTPFSLEELGLSPEEIAQLEVMQQGEQQPAAQAEPELTPFSLEELGLSPEEIAQLEAMQQGEQEPAAQAEPELTPFSLEELGLSPEEIAQLEAMQQGEQQPAAQAEPELTPFSLEELGLSPEEIAQLEAMQQGEQPPAATTAEEDLFDFSVAEAAPVAKAVRTTPRVEEPPPPPKPEDASFAPEPLDALDDIWQAPPEPAAPEPARVVLPPLAERAKPQPAIRAAMAEERRSVAPTRDDLRFARREAVTAGRGRSARAPLRPRAPEDFIPTGNAKLDDYLRQLSANPANHTLAFTIARLCAQTGQAELMAVVYRRLLKQTALLNRMAEELEDLINTVDDVPVLRQLHRLLGDVYSRQGRLDEAIAAYSVTFAE